MTIKNGSSLKEHLIKSIDSKYNQDLSSFLETSTQERFNVLVLQNISFNEFMKIATKYATSLFNKRKKIMINEKEQNSLISSPRDYNDEKKELFDYIDLYKKLHQYKGLSPEKTEELKEKVEELKEYYNNFFKITYQSMMTVRKKLLLEKRIEQ